MDLKEKIVSSYVAFEDGVNINSDIHEIRTEAFQNFEKLLTTCPQTKTYNLNKNQSLLFVQAFHWFVLRFSVSLKHFFVFV